MLGDATGFARGHVGLADVVHQGGLAVVDVAQEGDHRRTQLHLLGLILGDLVIGIFALELRLAFGRALGALLDLGGKAILLGHLLDDRHLEHLVDGGEHIQPHQVHNQQIGAHAHQLGQFLDGDRAIELELLALAGGDDRGGGGLDRLAEAVAALVHLGAIGAVITAITVVATAVARAGSAGVTPGSGGGLRPIGKAVGARTAGSGRALGALAALLLAVTARRLRGRETERDRRGLRRRPERGGKLRLGRLGLRRRDGRRGRGGGQGGLGRGGLRRGGGGLGFGLGRLDLGLHLRFGGLGRLDGRFGLHLGRLNLRRGLGLGRGLSLGLGLDLGGLGRDRLRGGGGAFALLGLGLEGKTAVRFHGFAVLASLFGADRFALGLAALALGLVVGQQLGSLALHQPLGPLRQAREFIGLQRREGGRDLQPQRFGLGQDNAGGQVRLFCKLGNSHLAYSPCWSTSAWARS